MKKRVFIASATLLLAIAGVFAAKRFEVTGNIYKYVPGSGFAIYQQNATIPCSTEGSGCVEQSTGYQLYLDQSGTKTPLFHD